MEDLERVRKIFYEDFHVPEELPSPKDTDSAEYLAYILRVRAGASVLYVREVLDAFSAVSKALPHASTSVLYARALAELAALTYYLRKNVRDAYQSSNLKVALEWVHKSFSGNRYLKKFFTPDSPTFNGLPRPAGLEFVDPMDLAKATKCFSVEVLREKEERLDYEFLSEVSHPNSAAINDHVRVDLQNRTVYFSRRPAEKDRWDSYVVRYAAHAALEIRGLIDLAKEIDPNHNENSSSHSA